MCHRRGERAQAEKRRGRMEEVLREGGLSVEGDRAGKGEK